MPDYYPDSNRKNLSGLVETFATWERAARGWRVWDYAVELEPAFSPIEIRSPIIIQVRDDARLGPGFGQFDVRRKPAALTQAHRQRPFVHDSTKPLAAYYRADDLSELQILSSDELVVSPATAGQFLLSLSSCRTPMAFELIADSEQISLQMACDATFAPVLKGQLKTFFPAISVIETRNTLISHFPVQPGTVIADFGLARNFVLSLNTFRSFEPEPLTGLISALAGLHKDQKAILQVLFQPTRFPWADQLQRIVANPDLKQIPSLSSGSLNEKLSSPFFAAVIRLAVQAASETESWRILRNLGGTLSLFSGPGGNELIALSNDGLPANNHHLSLWSRTSYRSGMLLNTAELASFVHLPSTSLKVEKLKRSDARTKALPVLALGGSLVLGVNQHNGESRHVTLSAEQRLKHIHVVGATGSGKSTMLIRSMILDAEQGHGFAAFDPHGDLIDSVLERIPDNRVKDVILFDPADEEFPIGFNILTAHSELEKTLLASDLVSIFKRFSTSWGDVMNSVLANAVLAFLESSCGGSLLGLKRFLIERSFREEFLSTIADDEIRYYWQNEFPQLRGKPYAPLLTRLDTFLRSKLIRHIVAQKQNTLDFRSIMDERKIFLARLSHGAVGIENAHMLGSLLVSKFYHAALSRQDIKDSNREPFFLYMDEAHNFVTESMNQILTGARKFGLGLIVSHQQLRQFQSGEADILGSVLSNCYARICFRLDEDAEKLAKGFSFFTADHLKNLGVGEAICRFEQSRYDFNLETSPLQQVAAEAAAKKRAEIVEQSRKRYAKPKADVEIENQRNPSFSWTREVGPSVPHVEQTSDVGTAQNPVGEITQTRDPETFEDKFGRGGTHHKEIQAVIKRMAESYGFRVEIERRVLDGSGSVDVSLEKDDLKIACEVSVTTTDYEVTNVHKCLTAGYDFVLVVVSNQKKLPLLIAKIHSEIPIEHQDKVKTFGLTGLLAFLRDLTVSNDPITRKIEKPAGQRLNFAEACEFFGVNSSTLYRWVREGRVPFYRPGREYQFDRDELVLIGKHDLSGKRKASVTLSPLNIDKRAPKGRKEQNSRYRKLLKLDKIEEPLRTRREKEAR